MNLNSEKSLISISDCPFCGSGDVGHGYREIGAPSAIAVITCAGCGASGPAFELGKTVEETIAADQAALEGWQKSCAPARPRLLLTMERTSRLYRNLAKAEAHLVQAYLYPRPKGTKIVVTGTVSGNNADQVVEQLRQIINQTDVA